MKQLNPVSVLEDEQYGFHQPKLKDLTHPSKLPNPLTPGSGLTIEWAPALTKISRIKVAEVGSPAFHSMHGVWSMHRQKFMGGQDACCT